MGPKRTIKFQGRDAIGQEISFQPDAESWSTYKLEDGTVMKVKSVVVNIFRLDEYNDKGEPIYMFEGTQIVSAQVPDEIRKKPH